MVSAKIACWLETKLVYPKEKAGDIKPKTKGGSLLVLSLYPLDRLEGMWKGTPVRK